MGEFKRFVNTTPISSENIFNRLMFFDTLNAEYTGNVKTKGKYVYSGLQKFIRALFVAPMLVPLCWIVINDTHFGTEFLEGAVLTFVIVFLWDKLVCLCIRLYSRFLSAVLRKNLNPELKRVRKQNSLIIFIGIKPKRIKYKNLYDKNRQITELYRKCDDTKFCGPDSVSVTFEFTDNGFMYRTDNGERNITLDYSQIKAAYETPDYIFLCGRKTVLTLEKNKFTVGTAEEFGKFLSEKLGEKRYNSCEHQRLVYNM